MAENKKIDEILMKHLRRGYFWLNLTTLAAQLPQTPPCFAMGEHAKRIDFISSQGRRSLGASQTLKIADSILVMDSNLLAAICDPFGSPQAAALS